MAPLLVQDVCSTSDAARCVENTASKMQRGPIDLRRVCSRPKSAGMDINALLLHELPQCTPGSSVLTTSRGTVRYLPASGGPTRCLQSATGNTVALRRRPSSVGNSAPRRKSQTLSSLRILAMCQSRAGTGTPPPTKARSNRDRHIPEGDYGDISSGGRRHSRRAHATSILTWTCSSCFRSALEHLAVVASRPTAVENIDARCELPWGLCTHR